MATLKAQNSHMLMQIVVSLCHILEDEHYARSAPILCGAVFYLSALFWGSLRDPYNPALAASASSSTAAVFDPTVIFDSILPYLFAAATYQIPVLTREILNSIKLLFNYAGATLQGAAHDVVLDICQLSMNPRLVGHDSSILRLLDDILQFMEDKYKAGSFPGNAEQLFSLVEAFPAERDISNALHFKSRNMQPNCEHWLRNLDGFLNRYFRHEPRVAVKHVALDIVGQLYDSAKIIYESEILGVLLKCAFEIRLLPFRPARFLERTSVFAASFVLIRHLLA